MLLRTIRGKSFVEQARHCLFLFCAEELWLRGLIPCAISFAESISTKNRCVFSKTHMFELHSTTMGRLLRKLYSHNDARPTNLISESSETLKCDLAWTVFSKVVGMSLA